MSTLYGSLRRLMLCVAEELVYIKVIVGKLIIRCAQSAFVWKSEKLQWCSPMVRYGFYWRAGYCCVWLGQRENWLTLIRGMQEKWLLEKVVQFGYKSEIVPTHKHTQKAVTSWIRIFHMHIIEHESISSLIFAQIIRVYRMCATTMVGLGF